MTDSTTDYNRSGEPGSTSQGPESKPSVPERSSDAIAPIKAVAADALGQANDHATSLASQVKDKALSAASDQKDGIADRIDEVAQAFHKSGGHFAGQQDWLASAIERGASELGAFATALRENDVSTLLEQVRSVAKRQPALFVGLSLAAGFAVARLGKIVAADVSRDDLPTLPEVGHGEK